PGANSEKYGSWPQPTDQLPSGSCWKFPWLAASNGFECVKLETSVAVICVRLRRRTIARDCEWTTGVPPLSKNVIVPLGPSRASCCQAGVALRPIAKLDFLPPRRQTTCPL